MAAKRMERASEAQAIIAKRRVTSHDPVTGEVQDLGPASEKGDVIEAPPTSELAAQKPQDPPAGGEAVSKEPATEEKGKPRDLKSRLKQVIGQRNEARTEGKGQEETIVGLRKEIVDLQKKNNITELRAGEGRPDNFDDLSDTDKMIWLTEKATAIASKPTEEAKPALDPDLAAYKAERRLVLDGFSMEEAVVLNEIITRHPNATDAEVAILAEAAAPDLFADVEDTGADGLPPSHTTSRPRSTRHTKVEEPDPRPALKETAMNGKSAKVRKEARMGLLRYARAHPVRVETKSR